MSKGVLARTFFTVVSLTAAVVVASGCFVSRSSSSSSSSSSLAVPDQPPREPTVVGPSFLPALSDTVAPEMNDWVEYASDVGSCELSSEGFGACADSDYLVFCHDGRVLALDCALFTGVDDSDGRCSDFSGTDPLTSCYVRAF